MEIKLKLEDKDAGLLLRVFKEGKTLCSDQPRPQERLDAVIESIYRQLQRELARLYPPGPIE